MTTDLLTLMLGWTMSAVGGTALCVGVRLVYKGLMG
jgi:hypothetical protein